MVQWEIIHQTFWFWV